VCGIPLPEEGLLKKDTIFFTSFAPHAGHCVSFSVAPILWSMEKQELHFLQQYS
jgi:hypothetical protein